jgi:chromate transporter
MPGPTLGQLAWTVARDVNRTVGGGYASMELLRRSFEKAQWLTPGEHGLLVAVSRLTPGTNILAYCVGLGWMRHRVVGATLALLASSVPSAFVVTVLSAALVRVDDWPVVQSLLAVAMLVASTLVLSTAWHLLRPYLAVSRRLWTVGLLAIVLALSLAGVTPVRVLLVAAAWGALLPMPPTSSSTLTSTLEPAPPLTPVDSTRPRTPLRETESS